MKIGDFYLVETIPGQENQLYFYGFVDAEKDTSFFIDFYLSTESATDRKALRTKR